MYMYFDIKYNKYIFIMCLFLRWVWYLRFKSVDLKKKISKKIFFFFFNNYNVDD